MRHTVRSNAVIVGDIHAGESAWKQSLNERSASIQQSIASHTNAVKHSPIISRREVCGRRLDKERVYNPITCRYNSPNASRPDIHPKPSGKKGSESHVPTSIAGETPEWFSGERRAYPTVTQTAFEQKTKSQLKPSHGSATSHTMPEYLIGDFTQIKSNKNIEREKMKEEAKLRRKSEAFKKVSSNPFKIDENKNPHEGLYFFDRFKKEVPVASKIPEDHPDFFQQNDHVPRKHPGPSKGSGKKRITLSDGKRGDISGDLPVWLLDQGKRIDPANVHDVPQEERTWYNGGVGGAIRSIFQTDYGQISDSTVSSDVPDFMLQASKRVCPDDVRELPQDKFNWHNGGTTGVRSQFDLEYGHVSDSTVSGDGPHFLVSLNKRVCPEEVRMPNNHEMKWHNRDCAPRRLLPHEQQSHHVVYSSAHTRNAHGEEKAVERNQTKTGMIHEADVSDWHGRQSLVRSSFSTPNLHKTGRQRSELLTERHGHKRRGNMGSLGGSTVSVIRGNEDPLQIQKLRRAITDSPAQRSNITCW